MSAPAPAISFTLDVECGTCQQELHHSVSGSEQEFKENAAKAVTASELHDCRSAPKGTKP